MRRSGVQIDILHLYRDCFRAVRSKPKPAQTRFKLFIRHEFRKAEVGPRDFDAIEYLLRRGKRQLELYKDPNVRDI
ncbi:hypothetical protein BJ085DRAFT_509, partial [Dimargaris cristalligena]